MVSEKCSSLLLAGDIKTRRWMEEYLERVLLISDLIPHASFPQVLAEAAEPKLTSTSTEAYLQQPNPQPLKGQV